MTTAKIFENGRSQAVRLPKEYRFKDKEIGISKVGEIVLLFPKEKAKDLFLEGLTGFSDDFMAEERDQGTVERRSEL